MKILHWNVLANRCANSTPQGFPHVDPEVLEWSVRFPKIIAMILAAEADLVSLVEVDRLADFRTALSSRYQCLQSAAEQAIFVRRDFSFQIAIPREYPLPENRFLSTVEFQFPDGTTLVFATVHLKAKPEFAAVRVRQVDAMLKILDPLPVPQIVCGDFNDTPDSECLELMLRKYRLSIPRGVVSTCKFRDSLVTRRIDYLLTRGISLRGQVPEVAIPKVGLPCAEFPSDHLYLTAEPC